MGLRRRSRELTLQFLFQNEFALKTAPASALRAFADNFSVEPEVVAYATELVARILAKQNEIDAMIQSCSAHWKIGRMGLVDLNVMRIATCEMAFIEPRVPASVAINEAVDLAKRYGSTESGAFVNGILDQVAKGLS